MDQRTIEAIQSIIDYMYDDELRDYQEQDEDGQQNHIFKQLQHLDNLVHEVTADE